MTRSFKLAVLQNPAEFAGERGRAAFRVFSEKLRDFCLTQEDKEAVQSLAYNFMRMKVKDLVPA